MNTTTERNDGMSLETLTSHVREAFTILRGHKYVNLTTFRKSGVPVVTTVWFAQDPDRVYVVTAAGSGKVKRIRNNAEVRLTPSTANGTVLGPTVDAVARIMSVDDNVRGLYLLQQKYGWMFRAFELLWRLRRTKSVILEIKPVTPA